MTSPCSHWPDVSTRHAVATELRLKTQGKPDWMRAGGRSDIMYVYIEGQEIVTVTVDVNYGTKSFQTRSQLSDDYSDSLPSQS